MIGFDKGYAEAAQAVSPVQGAINEIGGVIGAIEENLADLANKLDPVLRSRLSANADKNGAEPGVSCELEGRLRSKITALAIINDAIADLARRVAL